MAEPEVADLDPTPDPNPAPDPAPEPKEPDKPVVQSVIDADPQPVTEFPENWRDLMAGDDGKVRKLLDRYASPQAAANALMDFRKKESTGLLTKPLGDNPTDEELADYRSALGIPEKASDYNTEFDGVVYGDDDKAIIGDFLEYAHKANYTPAQVEAGLKWYNAFQEKELADQADADATTVDKTIDELRLEYGADYRRNMNVMESHLKTVFGDMVGEIKNARLADGTPLLAHAHVIRAFVDAAIEKNPLAKVVPGAGANQASAVEDELKALRKLQVTDPKTYWSAETQARELELISAQQSLK